MRLLQPEMAVWLLAVAPVVLGWTIRHVYHWRSRRRWRVTGAGHRPTGLIRAATTLGLATLSVVFLTGALTRPQLPVERITPTFEKQDLVLILDQSVSMRARDIPPSRFARAVSEIETFLDRKPATLDRIALVGFAGTAVVLSYPTSDLDSLFFYLDWVRDDPTALYGTNMSLALETALSVAEREKSRLAPLFVLVSDGDDHGAGLDAAVASVRRAGIRLYTVGIGTAADVPIPVRNEAGREELLRDDDGSVMRTRFQEGTLRRIATMTGGQYFRSAAGGELLRALDHILDEERRAIGATSRIEYHDLYAFLLAAAAASLLGLVILW